MKQEPITRVDEAFWAFWRAAGTGRTLLERDLALRAFYAAYPEYAPRERPGGDRMPQAAP